MPDVTDHPPLTVDVFDGDSPAGWNTWVSAALWGTLFQTTFWADRLCELWDCRPVYFVVRGEGEALPTLILQAMEVRSDHAADERRPLKSRLKEVIARLRERGHRLQWFGQPAVIHPGWAGRAFASLFPEVEAFCQRERLSHIQTSEAPGQAQGVLPVAWLAKPWATYYVDLQPSEEALWQNLKKSARKAIRRAQSDGISVRVIASVEELRDYYTLACRWAERYGKHMYGFVDFETMWRHFHVQGVFETFVAEKDGEPLAGLSVWGYNGLIGELGAFQSERSFEENLYGPDLIKWEALKWGAQQGHRFFDLAGVSPEPQTPKEQGIRQFKEKWGGQYSEYVLVSKKFRG